MGLSLGEILLIVIVGIIFVGPKRLPGVMRTAGQWVARIRRMSVDLRSQSGIDDILRHEGLDQSLSELRSLARLNVVETIVSASAASGARPVAPVAPVVPGAPGAPVVVAPPAVAPVAVDPRAFARPIEPSREREYPVGGCDAYGALPDDAVSYAEVSS